MQDRSSELVVLVQMRDEDCLQMRSCCGNPLGQLSCLAYPGRRSTKIDSVLRRSAMRLHPSYLPRR